MKSQYYGGRVESADGLWRGQRMVFHPCDPLHPYTWSTHYWRLESFELGLPAVIAKVSALGDGNSVHYAEMTFWLGDGGPRVMTSVQVRLEYSTPLDALEAALRRIRSVVDVEMLPAWARSEPDEVPQDALWSIIMYHAQRSAELMRESAVVSLQNKALRGAFSLTPDEPLSLTPDESPSNGPTTSWETVDMAAGVVDGEPADAVEDACSAPSALPDSLGWDDCTSQAPCKRLGCERCQR